MLCYIHQWECFKRKEYNNSVGWSPHGAMELGKNHCLPLRFPFRVLFGSEEVPYLEV